MEVFYLIIKFLTLLKVIFSLIKVVRAFHHHNLDDRGGSSGMLISRFNYTFDYSIKGFLLPVLIF